MSNTLSAVLDLYAILPPRSLTPRDMARAESSYRYACAGHSVSALIMSPDVEPFSPTIRARIVALCLSAQESS